MIRTRVLAYSEQRQNRAQQGQRPQHVSQIHVYTRRRERSHPGELDADDCETSGRERKPQAQERQRRLMKRLEQPIRQHIKHVLRLPVGNCRAAADDIEAMHDEFLPERLQTVTSAAAFGARVSTSHVLLHSVAGGFLGSDSRDQYAVETRNARLSSFVCAPTRDCPNSLSLDGARGQSLAGGSASYSLAGAAAGAEVKMGEKATGSIGAPVYRSYLDCASFGNFLESPCPEDSSDRSIRSRECSACSSFSSGSVGRSAALCIVAIESAGRVIVEDSGDPQKASSGRLLQQQQQMNIETGQGTLPQFHDEWQQEDPHQQEEELLSNERLKQVVSRGRGGQKAVRSIVATQKAFEKTGSLLSLGPQLLRDTQLASKVRVLQRDPTTGAVQERMVQVLLIHRNPEIFYIPELLTDADCDHLIEICRGRWERSKTSTGYATADPREYSSMNSANRTSSSVPLEAGETLGVEIVERLAAAFADMNLENLEPLVIVRYEPGQCFKAHHDGGFRPKTLLLYLNGGVQA